MQMKRLLEMVYILLDKKKCTANELAEHFEVSKRTILRDIDSLSAAGIPIYTTKGKDGGISILENFVLNKALLTDDEQKEILYALQSLRATEYKSVDKALSRLSSMFQKTDQNWIEVDFSRWGQTESDNKKFALLKDSILTSHAVQFDYINSYGESRTRVVYPLELLFKSKAWYLQAYCVNKQDYRVFKLNRMINLKQLNEPFDRFEYSYPKLLNTSSENLIDLELVFPSSVAYRVYDEFDEGCIDRDELGNLHVVTKVPNDDWLISFLLSFGKDVEIIKPKEIIEILKQKIN